MCAAHHPSAGGTPPATAHHRPAPRARYLLYAAVFAGCLLLRVQVARHGYAEDDAYITYRYAANLASGVGFVYNAGERVLGTTTPLLTLLLAGVGRLGGDLPTAGLTLSLFCSALCCVLLLDLVLAGTGSVVAGLAGAALLALSASQARIGASGMETALLGALMLGSYRLLLAERPRGAGLLAGAAALVRPEGVLWLLLCLPALRRRGHWSWAAALGALLPLLAWVVLATCYFGSAIPHSVAAKMLQVRLGLSVAKVVPLELLLPLGPPWVLALVAAGGVLLVVRGDRLLAVPVLFSLAFTTAYAVVRPMMYPWYPGPLQVAMALVAATVLAHVLRAAAAPPVRWPAAVAALTAVLCLALLLQTRSGEHYHLLTRQPPPEGHLQVARWIATSAADASSVLVGDVGYVGYYNQGRRVVDYYGLVWRAPLERMTPTARMAPAGGWFALTLQAAQPDLALCHRGEYPGGTPAGYEAVAAPELPYYRVFRRHK